LQSFIYLSFGKKIPCLWEKGGSTTHRGYAMIIAGKNGREKVAIYNVISPPSYK